MEPMQFETLVWQVWGVVSTIVTALTIIAGGIICALDEIEPIPAVLKGVGGGLLGALIGIVIAVVLSLVALLIVEAPKEVGYFLAVVLVAAVIGGISGLVGRRL